MAVKKSTALMNGRAGQKLGGLGFHHCNQYIETLKGIIGLVPMDDHAFNANIKAFIK